MHPRHWILCSLFIVYPASTAIAQSTGGDFWFRGRRTSHSALPVTPDVPPGVFGASDNGYVGIYADLEGTEPCIQLPSVGNFYVIATPSGGTSTGFTGAEFRIEASNPSSYFWIVTPNPNAAVSIGNLFEGGVNIAFPTCEGDMPGDKVLLYTVTAIPNPGGPEDLLVKRREPPGNVDFPCPLFTLCDFPNFSKVCMLTCPEGDPDPIAFKAQLNTTPCTDLGPCPTTPCPEACVSLETQVPDLVCEGEPFTTTTVATNCAADPESIYVYVNGVVAGAFGDVPPGGTVQAMHTIPAAQCTDDHVPVEFLVRGVIPGCPPAMIMRDVQIPCHTPPCDGQGPDCTLAAATVPTLWPANHQLVTVGITGVTTSDGMPATIEINGVTSDEIVNGLGDGDTCPDAILGGDTVQLRAERSGTGNGRVYTVHFTATDVAGNTCTGAVTVCVPHDASAGSVCSDDGGTYDVTTCDMNPPTPMAPRQGLQMARDARAGIGLTFALDQAGPVELIVFDIAGRAVRTLASGPYPAGVHTVHWSGLDATGRPVANGVYFFRLRAAGESQSVKGVWMR